MLIDPKHDVSLHEAEYTLMFNFCLIQDQGNAILCLYKPVYVSHKAHTNPETDVQAHSLLPTSEPPKEFLFF